MIRLESRVKGYLRTKNGKHNKNNRSNKNNKNSTYPYFTPRHDASGVYRHMVSASGGVRDGG
ncbi:hypothetical protein GCM10025772_17390 [Ferrimonas gelatinilytica]|uniref:Uncharacterized protein n=1 Tax=Ferrimonas gelatinilytica TaxID=1255257 RepID=A0ABP9S445_9GAMM